MDRKTLHKIEKLLGSSDVAKLSEGLELVKSEIKKVDPEEARPLFEVLSSIFFIDPLERPDLASILGETISLVVGLGKWVIPILIQKLEAGDIKAQLVCAQALGSIGAEALKPLIEHYESTPDPKARTFLLYAISKVKAPEVIQAASLVTEAARSPDQELRDTATRAIGKFVESIPQLPDPIRRKFVESLRTNVADMNTGIRAKAIRSLGKLARFNHLSAEDREILKKTCNRILGQDEEFEWDRAYVVRKEAEEALGYL